VINKADMRPSEAVENLLRVIREDLPDAELMVCGDPRGTNNWMKAQCAAGHGRNHFAFEWERNRWSCEKEIEKNPDGTWITCGKWGDDRAYGHDELINFTLVHLPPWAASRSWQRSA